MTYKLTVAARNGKGKQVRSSGKIPGVVYGGGQTGAQSIILNLSEFQKLYKQAGESSLIDLVLDAKEAGKVLVQEVQLDPVKDVIIHVDLRRIDMNKEMTAPITLKFIGEAPIVKSSGGTIVTNLTTVEVKCLPKDLVSQIEVDLSALTSYDLVIKVKDLKLATGITIVSPNAEDLVAKATPALTEEEIKAMEEAATTAVDLSKIEVTGKKKEEEGAEAGAEPAEKEKKEEKK